MFCGGHDNGGDINKGKLGANAMKRVAAGAHLPTPWLFEPAKCLDNTADYCLDCSFLPQLQGCKEWFNHSKFMTWRTLNNYGMGGAKVVQVACSSKFHGSSIRRSHFFLKISLFVHALFLNQSSARTAHWMGLQKNYSISQKLTVQVLYVFFSFVLT